MRMSRVDELMTRELERFRAEHPRSHELAEQARRTLLGGVPMHWMVRWPGGFPVFAARRRARASPTSTATSTSTSASATPAR